MGSESDPIQGRGFTGVLSSQGLRAAGLLGSGGEASKSADSAVPSAEDCPMDGTAAAALLDAAVEGSPSSTADADAAVASRHG